MQGHHKLLIKNLGGQFSKVFILRKAPVIFVFFGKPNINPKKSSAKCQIYSESRAIFYPTFVTSLIRGRHKPEKERQFVFQFFNGWSSAKIFIFEQVKKFELL